MIKSYFLFAWRRLLNDKRTAFINLFGLTLGIIGFLLIMEYVYFEKSYDKFHQHKNRLYRIGLEVYRDGKLNIRSAINYAGVGPSLKDEYSEVEQYARVVNGESDIQIGTQHFREENTFFAEEGLFTMFSFPMVNGNPATALQQPNSAVIAESIALKYFGTVECVGERMIAHNNFNYRDFVITGVFKDLPEQTHMKGNIFLSFSTFSNQPDFILPWQWRDFYTYILLKENADATAFFNKISSADFVNAHNKTFEERKMHHRLVPQKVTDIYLHSNLAHEMNASGNASVLTVLQIVAIFVLGMAWVNFLNLSTATAIKRIKEIGIRKTIGALKKDILKQFISEAVLLNVLALILAAVVFIIIKPSFNQLAGKNLSMPPTAWLILIIVIAAGVLASVWYPASVLGSFSPHKALKEEKIAIAKGGWLRKGLIVFQFAISAILIICTITVVMQLNHMRHAKLGVDIEQTIVVRAPIPVDSATFSTYRVFKQQLLNNPDIKAVTASHVVPGDEGHWTPAIRKLDDITGNAVTSVTASANAIEPGFLQQYGIPVKHGRDLSGEYGTDHTSLLLTETAAKKLGYDNPQEALNKRMILMGDTFTVVGITGDFRHYSMKYEPEPYVFFQWLTDTRKYSVKVSGNNIAATIDFIRSRYEKLFPQHHFEYVFADELFAKQYASEKKLGIIVSLFTAMAIAIACLGLLGLTVFVIQKRVKEIGIRKVLGAGVMGITQMLSADFIKWVLVSLLVAVPVAWMVLSSWLQQFAYRIALSWWVFALAGLAILVMAVLTVSVQTIRAALANPVKALRSE